MPSSRRRRATLWRARWDWRQTGSRRPPSSNGSPRTSPLSPAGSPASWPLILMRVRLGNTLYYGYGWYFRGAALLFAGAGVVGILRGRCSCTLGGARVHWRLLVTVAVVMTAVYASLYWLTTYLARTASSR